MIVKCQHVMLFSQKILAVNKRELAVVLQSLPAALALAVVSVIIALLASTRQHTFEVQLFHAASLWLDQVQWPGALNEML